MILLLLGAAAALAPVRLGAYPSAQHRIASALPLPQLASDVRSHRTWTAPLIRPRVVAFSSRRSRRAAAPRMGILPTTLCEFWGAHAIAWAAASASIALDAFSGSHYIVAGTMAALSATSASLAVVLGRNQEEAGVELALAGAVSFAGFAAILQAAIGPLVSIGAVTSAPRLLLLLRALRTWHALLAVGALCFGLKSANKDRLFATTAKRTAGVQLPTLALFNVAAGAKMGDALAGQLAKEAARREATREPVLPSIYLPVYLPVYLHIYLYVLIYRSISIYMYIMYIYIYTIDRYVQIYIYIHIYM